MIAGGVLELATEDYAADMERCVCVFLWACHDQPDKQAEMLGICRGVAEPSRAPAEAPNTADNSPTRHCGKLHRSPHRGNPLMECVRSILQVQVLERLRMAKVPTVVTSWQRGGHYTCQHQTFHKSTQVNVVNVVIKVRWHGKLGARPRSLHGFS